MTRLVGALVSAVAVVFVSGAARAQAPDTRFRPRLEAAVGADAGLAFGNFCDMSLYDVASCSSVQSLPDLRAELGLRFAKAFSVGLIGRYSGGSRDGELPVSNDNGGAGVPGTAHERLWWLSGEGRWHVLGDRAVDPSLGFELGFVHTSNSWRAGSASGSTGHSGPAFGPSAGVDFKLGRYVALGVVLRTAYLLLPKYRSSFATPFTEPTLEGNVFSSTLGLTLGGRFEL